MEAEAENYGDLSLLTSHAGRVRIPDQRDKVYKDECFFSFDSPVSQFCTHYIGSSVSILCWFLFLTTIANSCLF